MKYLKLFENFGSNYPNIIKDSSDNDFISQMVTFKISDKLKSWFEDDIWIKKFQTEEFKEEGIIVKLPIVISDPFLLSSSCCVLTAGQLFSHFFGITCSRL